MLNLPSKCWSKNEITACMDKGVISDVIMQKSVQCAAMLHCDKLVTFACSLNVLFRQ